MKRRDLLTSGLRAGVAIVAAPMINRGRFRLFAGVPLEYSSRAIELVGRSLVIDMLGLLTLDSGKLEQWQRTPNTFTAWDFQKLKTSGITVFNPAIALDREDSREDALQLFQAWRSFIDKRRDNFLPINSGADLARAKTEGRIGILMGMQNSGHFHSVEDVQLFEKLGQRLSQLTYNTRNALGCGCLDRSDNGLTDYGAAVVERMNKVGMAIDISHTGDRTALDTFELSTKPVLITHSNCRALVAHPRCKPDNIIKVMANRGGVMGITAIRMFASHREPATIERVLDHFDHVARLVGVEHLGVGSDMDLDGRDRFFASKQLRFDISGLNHPRRMYDLTEGLVRRKYSNDSIELILGRNFQRVLSEIL